MITLNELKEKLNQMVDPTVNKPFAETKGIKHVGIDEEANKAILLISLQGFAPDDIVRQLRISIIKYLKTELKFAGVKLEIEVGEEEKKVEENKENSKIRYIAIASGKGGVGKSTVTANLAATFARLGHKVGIIDADVYGPSIPRVLDLPEGYPQGTSDQKIIPKSKFNIEVISTDFFVEGNKPLMWRGPMLRKMLEHFFNDVKWDEDIEYIFVDLPPGTGDVALDIQSFIPQCEMIIVTTPHPTASHIAVKAGFGAEQLKHKLLGVIENMSYFINPVNNQKELIFGEGGGKTVAEQLKVDLLAKIPIGQPSNKHHSIYSLDEEIGLEYLGIAKKLLNQ